MNRLIIGLITATLGMQVLILYLQHRSTSSQQAAPRTIREAPTGSIMDLSGLPAQGSVEAKIVIVEFSDYECPFCARHANGVAREFSDKYVKPGIVRHVFANNPLVMHPHSTLLATAAFCAGEQDAYWEMHDLLFAEMPSVPPSSSTLIDGKGALKETLKSRATNLGLNPALFSECLEGSRAADRLASDMSLAQKFQLSGTPAFAIGLVEGKERLLIKRFVQGAVPLTVFDSVIDDLSEAITKGD